MNKVILDTNIVSLFLDKELSILSKLRAVSEIYIPAVVIGEVYFGAYNSERVGTNIIRVRTIARYELLLFSKHQTPKTKHQIWECGK